MSFFYKKIKKIFSLRIRKESNRVLTVDCLVRAGVPVHFLNDHLYEISKRARSQRVHRDLKARALLFIYAQFIILFFFCQVIITFFCFFTNSLIQTAGQSMSSQEREKILKKCSSLICRYGTRFFETFCFFCFFVKERAQKKLAFLTESTSRGFSHTISIACLICKNACAPQKCSFLFSIFFLAIRKFY